MSLCMFYNFLQNIFFCFNTVIEQIKNDPLLVLLKNLLTEWYEIWIKTKKKLLQ